ncbi:MAG: sugar phosphate isomerase/epimerase [Bacteroidales bacterium]|nr:sugar phosphate isomerase/epimerase [Bacteroidales bacterium]
MKRRSFLRNSTAAIAGISLLNTGFISRRASISREIGIQLYTLAKPLSDDFPGVIKKLAEFGYKNLEFAGPYYFSPEEEIKTNPLITLMGLSGYGYHGHTPKEIRKMLDDLGLKSKSAHISDASLKHNIDEAINAAKIIGQEYILSPMFIGQSADDYKAAAELYNKFGEKCKEAGIRYGYHTHSQEFAIYDGATAFDILVKNTDPGLVCFELDLFWATVAGVDPVKVIQQYPGRVKLLHIKEMTKKMDKIYNTNEPFDNMAIAMEIMGNQTIIGEGIIDFKTIINQVDNAGIEYMVIESDFPPEPIKFAEESIKNLKKIISKV